MKSTDSAYSRWIRCVFWTALLTGIADYAIGFEPTTMTDAEFLKGQSHHGNYLPGLVSSRSSEFNPGLMALIPLRLSENCSFFATQFHPVRLSGCTSGAQLVGSLPGTVG